MAKETLDVVLPSNPDDRRKIRDAIYEISGVMQQIKDKRSFINDVKKDLKEKYGLPPKITTKMAKIVNEHNYQDVMAEVSALEVAYESLFETNLASNTTNNCDEEDA